MVVNAGLLLIATMLASESYLPTLEISDNSKNSGVFDVRTYLVIRIGLWLLNQIHQVRRP